MDAKKALKELSYDETAYGGYCTFEVRQEAIKALEKQIPKKPKNIKSIPTFSNDVYLTRANCPICGYDLNRSNIYCNRCGQKIDWE